MTDIKELNLGSSTTQLLRKNGIETIEKLLKLFENATYDKPWYYGLSSIGDFRAKLIYEAVVNTVGADSIPKSKYADYPYNLYHKMYPGIKDITDDRIKGFEYAVSQLTNGEIEAIEYKFKLGKRPELGSEMDSNLKRAYSKLRSPDLESYARLGFEEYSKVLEKETSGYTILLRNVEGLKSVSHTASRNGINTVEDVLKIRKQYGEDWSNHRPGCLGIGEKKNKLINDCVDEYLKKNNLRKEIPID